MKRGLVVAAAAAGVAWWMWPSDDADRGPAVDVANRVWIDHMPKDPRDKMDVLAVIDDPSLKVGSFARSSAYEGDFSVFEWSRQRPTELQVTMLQSGARHELTAKVTKGDCGAFDYCLVLEGAPRGPVRYGSMRDWIIESAADLPVKAAEIATRAPR